MHNSTGFRLKRKDFQGLVHGNETDLYIIRNSNGLEAAITNYGCRLVGLMAPDRNGTMDDVVLGFNRLDDYLLANEVFHGALIGRVCNRISDGKFFLSSTQYSLPLDAEGIHLHGGPEGFHSHVWNVLLQDTNSITFSYRSPDGEMGYPGNLEVEVFYELSDRNEFIIHHQARTDKPTPVNLTSHPYFNLGGEGSGSIERHILRINAERITTIDSRLLPKGEYLDVAETPFDFRDGKSIAEGLIYEESDPQLKNGKGYDHNFVLNKSINVDKNWAATITDPKSGRQMQVFTEEPGIQFYSGNSLDRSDIGKSGKAYGHREAFALETQHFPDSPNQQAFPSIILNPGELYSTRTIYQFKVQG